MRAHTLHFLLVEDDDDHAMLVVRGLRRGNAGCTVDRARDGVEAMDYLRHVGAYAQSPRPDVILLDLNMPRMNGHEVLERVKGDPDLRKIPVVIFTTSDNTSDRERAYGQHVNSYLVKPLDFAEFQDTTRELGRYWGNLNQTIE